MRQKQERMAEKEHIAELMPFETGKSRNSSPIPRCSKKSIPEFGWGRGIRQTQIGHHQWERKGRRKWTDRERTGERVTEEVEFRRTEEKEINK